MRLIKKLLIYIKDPEKCQKKTDPDPCQTKMLWIRYFLGQLRRLLGLTWQLRAGQSVAESCARLCGDVVLQNLMTFINKQQSSTQLSRLTILQVGSIVQRSVCQFIGTARSVADPDGSQLGSTSKGVVGSRAGSVSKNFINTEQ